MQPEIMKRIGLLIVFSLAAFLSVAAQDASTPAPTPKTISGGILNKKAISLPKAEYPDAARQAKAFGEVKVQILTDESGKVISAKAVDGSENIALRQAAESAALKATFQPTLLSGVPVKVSGSIVYNFVPAGGREEQLKMIALGAFFGTMRAFVNDLNTFRSIFDGDRMLIEIREDLPEIATEIDAFSSIEKLSPMKRTELIDKTRELIVAKLTDDDKWQFAVGTEMSNIWGSFVAIVPSSPNKEPDLSRLDISMLNGGFSKLDELMKNAPKGFPGDIRMKFKELIAAGRKTSYSSDDTVLIFDKLDALMTTISPEQK